MGMPVFKHIEVLLLLMYHEHRLINIHVDEVVGLNPVLLEVALRTVLTNKDTWMTTRIFTAITETVRMTNCYDCTP